MNLEEASRRIERLEEELYKLTRDYEALVKDYQKHTHYINETVTESPSI